jgi:sn-glycerol 3-phosphate transport system substrate-binding protein
VPQARTAVEQLPLTEPQDAARVFIPGGDQIIGKGLERILINNEPVEQVFAEVKATLEQEAEPVKRDLAALG